MKTFKNETTRIPGENGKTMTYEGLIRNCIDHTPKNGFTFSDMRERGRIEKALDKMDDDLIKFEDNDTTNLKKVVDLMQWGTRDKDLIAFADAIDDLAKASPDEDVDEKPKET